MPVQTTPVTPLRQIAIILAHCVVRIQIKRLTRVMTEPNCCAMRL